MAVHTKMSGNHYLAAIMKHDSDEEIRQIPIRIPNNCDHSSSVCPTKECYESWGYDWKLLPQRTAGGRALVAQING